MDSKSENVKFIDENVGVLEISESSITFTPPLYRQRYQKVKEKIESYSKGTYFKILDLGCSDLKFFRYLRDIPGIQEIVVLDKDETTLKDNIHRVKPLLTDFVMLRTEPLHVKAMCADATVYNPLMKDVQVVTMIELIEHMYPSELPNLVDNVFRKIRPRLVIVTTPNADFNQYIPNFVPGSFRHWDHKFEWTGEEFREWCYGVVHDTLDYNVQISGCGLGPHSTYCSQMALFFLSTSDEEEFRDQALRNVSVNTLQEPIAHDLSIQKDDAMVILEIEYPVDRRSQDEKDKHFTLHRFQSLIHYLQKDHDDQNNPDWGNEENDEIEKENSDISSPCEEIEKKNSDKSSLCDWFPIQQKGNLQVEKTHCEMVTFCCVHVDNEEEIESHSNCKGYSFYIISHRYAVITMPSLSAWVNLDADRILPADFIRSIIDDKCYDCKGDGETWQGKTLLWPDPSDDEDTWEDINNVSSAMKQVEEDWGFDEYNISNDSDWDS